MTAKTIDLVSYAHLLSEYTPRVPRTEKENDKLIAIVRDLGRKEQPTPEEDELVEVLVALIEDFEEAHYSMKKSEPHVALQEIMLNHDAKPKDLYEIFGSKGTTSEVLSGKRAISKAAARKLAQRFHAPIELFL